MADTTMHARDDAALVWSPPFDIELGWLDGNGHLNMAYYHVMFDRTVDLALDVLGLGDAYRTENKAGLFTVETHVIYRSEVHAHDKVRVSFQLLGCDEKRLHAFQTMVREADGQLAATSENLFVHVDLEARRAAPFPADGLTRARDMVAAHAAVGTSKYVGRRIAPLGD
ncbi:thioesterase family protein [Acuticoccus mangrovi]|uniref:Thioesterase family protein n=1 Tax=Acuticoccus mangrovi TaxID=2796142 RepID=A0A934IP59_9HYPH|nr:thioesterase family protein [Acuticoccus mangrovi]MBJ3775500.1 thioesterase family protein [Acuticoccus mangrovi]